MWAGGRVPRAFLPWSGTRSARTRRAASGRCVRRGESPGRAPGRRGPPTWPSSARITGPARGQERLRIGVELFSFSRISRLPRCTASKQSLGRLQRARPAISTTGLPVAADRLKSYYRRRIRSSYFSCRSATYFTFWGAKCSPLRHKCPPLLEKITAPVGGFDLVADGVRQRHFHHVSCSVRFF